MIWINFSYNPLPVFPSFIISIYIISCPLLGRGFCGGQNSEISCHLQFPHTHEILRFTWMQSHWPTWLGPILWYSSVVDLFDYVDVRAWAKRPQSCSSHGLLRLHPFIFVAHCLFVLSYGKVTNKEELRTFVQRYVGQVVPICGPMLIDLRFLRMHLYS